MIETSKEIATRWHYEGLQDEIAEIEADQAVHIGFLGDFSSGKSTLINEFVDIEDLLPVDVEPCTANAGMVVALEGLSKPAFFCLDHSKNLEAIPRPTFDDLAQGNGEGRPVAHVPPRPPGFPSGFVLVDTPGLASLNRDHLDVTFGELPFLDAAVICVDIQKGGLTGSVIEFLNSPGVRHLKDRFIVALTHTDRPNVENAKVREEVAKKLAHTVECSADEAQERVIETSAGPKARERDISQLDSTMAELFAKRHTLLSEERRKRAANSLAPKAIELLENHRLALQGSDNEFESKIKEIESRQEEVQKERRNQEKLLDELQSRLKADIEAICRRYEPIFSAAPSDEVRQESISFSRELAEAIDKRLERLETDLKVSIDGRDARLRTLLQRIDRGTDFFKTAVTAAVTAAIFPGAGALNIVEAGAGVALGTVSRGGAILKAIHDVNPVNFLGDFLGEQIKDRVVKAQLNQISKDLAKELRDSVEEYFEQEVFSRLETALSEQKEHLKEARKSRTEDLEARSRQITAIETDLAAIRGKLE